MEFAAAARICSCWQQQCRGGGDSEIQKPAGSLHTHIIDAAGQLTVHSATLENLPDGGVGAWWYGGSREGARDVAIWSARFSPEADSWTPAEVALDRKSHASQQVRYIKKLGNPSAHLDDQGRLWLFFVSVSVGGWAGSAVNVMQSMDGGLTWSKATRLVTSPFFNVSTLVRTNAVRMLDGSIILPVYHQFLGRFAELLTLDSEMHIRGKTRLAWGRKTLQPAVIPVSPEVAAAVMRHGGPAPGQMLIAITRDGGKTYSRPAKTELPNADNSVVGGLARHGRPFVIYNSSPASRNILSLAVSDREFSTWNKVYDFENAGSDHSRRFSYPSYIRDRKGRHHVVWTHDRRNIKHVVFDDVWLAAALDRLETDR